jgi:zinc transport system permease protein
MSYLFGDITLVSRADLWLVGGLDVLVGGAVWLFYPQFLAICFDEEFARLRGVRVEVYYLLLLCLTALTIVLLVKILGILMVIALLTLPAATASLMARKLGHLMALSVLLCALFTSGGLACAYTFDLYSGPVIILLAGAAYLLALVAQKIKPLRLKKSPNRERIRNRGCRAAAVFSHTPTDPRA